MCPPGTGTGNCVHLNNFLTIGFRRAFDILGALCNSKKQMKYSAFSRFKHLWNFQSSHSGVGDSVFQGIPFSADLQSQLLYNNGFELAS